MRTSRRKSSDAVRRRDKRNKEKDPYFCLLAGCATVARTAKRASSGRLELQNHEAKGKSPPGVMRTAALKTDSGNEIGTGKIRADRCMQHY
jgi:hypothetical protein